MTLAEIVTLFQDTMWLPDPGIVYVVLAAVVANRLPGDPVFLLVVGPPSSGKTEALGALSDLPEYFAVSTLTEAGLLSGSPGDAGTGGLLVQIGDRGLMVMSDFGTLLNEHGSTRNRIFALLREVFDGKLVRHLGTNGGRTFAWQGHAGLIAACTEAIDSPSIDLGLLGERFTYYRVPTVTPDADFMACVVADENAGRQPAVRLERSQAIASFSQSITIPDSLPAITETEQERLVTLATIGTRCRSSVHRDGYTREIDLVPGAERSPRLYGQLRQMHAGLTLIGTPTSETWRLLAKLSLDGMHQGRRAVIDYLMRAGGIHSTSSIAGHCRMPETPVRRHLQDLTAHGVVDLDGSFPERWSASLWLRKVWWAVEEPQPQRTSL
jgi:hypothetical protein